MWLLVGPTVPPPKRFTRSDTLNELESATTIRLQLSKRRHRNHNSWRAVVMILFGVRIEGGKLKKMLLGAF